MAPDIHSSFDEARDPQGNKILYVSGAENSGRVTEHSVVDTCSKLSQLKNSLGEFIWQKFEEYAELALKEENQTLAGDILWDHVDLLTPDPSYLRKDLIDIGFPMDRTSISIYNLVKDRDTLAPTKDDEMVIVPTDNGDVIARQDRVDLVLKSVRKP